MKKLVLVLLALPLVGCVTPRQLQVAQNNCRALAAGQTGFYGGGGQINPAYAYRAYANDYYTCFDQEKYAAAYYGYGGYAYSYPYAYGYSYAYPYGYPYYSGYYGPGVAVGVGRR